MGYSTSSRGYRVYNKRIIIIEESIYVVFDKSKNSCLRNDDEEQIKLDKQIDVNKQA